MPIEIKELHIKIAVGESSNPSSQQTAEDIKGKDEIIETCVEQVMEILSKKGER